MLRVIVELWPGGRESSKRVIATADIGRIRNGKHADYEVELHEALLVTSVALLLCANTRDGLQVSGTWSHAVLLRS